MIPPAPGAPRALEAVPLKQPVKKQCAPLGLRGSLIWRVVWVQARSNATGLNLVESANIGHDIWKLHTA